MKNHEKQPETMKNHENTSENHENQPTSVKNHCIKTHRQSPNNRNCCDGNVCSKKICIALLKKKGHRHRIAKNI